MPEYLMVDGVARPAVPRSHAVRSGNFVFVSVTPNRPDRSVPQDDFATQMRQCMENLSIILDGAGSALDQVIRMNFFLADVRRDRPELNDIYRTYFAEDRLPVRTTVGATLPNPDFLLELECIAEVQRTANTS